MNNSRRDFIKNTSVVSLGFIGLNQFISTGCGTLSGLGYAPLVSASDGILSLPEGFSSAVISRKGDLMNDGLISRGMHDGMGVFKWNNDKIILIRNHENLPAAETGPFGAGNKLMNKISRDKIYDIAKGERTCVGGTTTLVYNEKSGKIEYRHI